MIRDLGGYVVVDMILFCPACGLQHIDAATEAWSDGPASGSAWDNPPHRSHLCHGCGHIWRPSDTHTNGVAEIRSRGVNDSAPVKPVQYDPLLSEWERPD